MRRLLFLFGCISISTCFAQELPLNKLQLPPGFNIEVFAAPVPDARQLTRGDKGTIFVGTREENKVYAIISDAKEPHGTRVITIASGLNTPNGVAFSQGSLYVAEIDRILRYDNIEEQLTTPPKPVVIINNLPNKTWHGWRYIAFGPDGKLYITIGVPCNVCIEKDPRFGTISRLDKDGKNFEIYASGIRNSVGMDWDPNTKKMWFTDNGRDYWGDNSPPDELNYAPEKGLFFGFPYFSGNIPDNSIKKPKIMKKVTPPALELPAHVAALGMKFYSGKAFPEDYQNQIFIAEHGSWNRSKKIGYRIVSVKIAGDRVVNAKPFITGWLQDQSAWGRPVDLLVLPDGSLLISDDHAGVVYRVKYNYS